MNTFYLVMAIFFSAWSAFVFLGMFVSSESNDTKTLNMLTIAFPITVIASAAFFYLYEISV